MSSRASPDPARPPAAPVVLASMLILASAIVPGGGVPAAEQAETWTADTGFDPGIAEPTYPGDGPVVCIDEAHRNYHTMAGSYGGFAALLAADGYGVRAWTEPFAEAALSPCRVLVIANALGPASPADSAFAAEEVEAVKSWVEAGGSLLLIADHAPFGSAASRMGEALGVRMLNGWVEDPEHMDSPRFGASILRFDRKSGLVRDHPITRGRAPDERIETIVTFGGQALRGGEGSTALLALSPTARSFPDLESMDPASGTSVGGWAQAVALEHGKGRAVVLGEAAFFTVQLVRGPVATAAGVEKLRVGMTWEDTDNRQLVLNTVHWLSGLL